jgi:tetratricopeptide (TPR) repeat protein
LKRSAQDDSFEAPEPTHSEARDRRADARAQNREDSNTKVERRASVRPSAFGAPRKSAPPAALEPSATAAEVATREHQRVLEAARLLDSVAPALLAGEPIDEQAAPRLPNQRARGVEHLVLRGSADPHAAEALRATSAAPSPLVSHEDNSLATPAAASSSARASRSPVAASLAGGAVLTTAQGARAARRPWLSVLLFGGMIALSIVPLMRYAESAEPPLRAGIKQPSSASGLTPARADDEVSAPTQPSEAQGPQASAAREPLIAGLLSEGTHALEANDIREAERMFGRVLELAEDNPRAAYGLARIRLIQNNLSGAEGWIQLALRKRPRRASYHTLYGEVLTRMGRITEAREEQGRAGASRDSDEP